MSHVFYKIKPTDGFVTGDRVWYWARRSGERAHRKVGLIKGLTSDGSVARVDLEATTVVPIQTVQTSRLYLFVGE